jgi:hypothetical protein
MMRRIVIALALGLIGGVALAQDPGRSPQPPQPPPAKTLQDQ